VGQQPAATALRGRPLNTLVGAAAAVATVVKEAGVERGFFGFLSS